MNEIFSIKRFGKLLKSDLSGYVLKNSGFLLVALAIMPIIWAYISYLGVSPMGEQTRFGIILFIVFICSFSAPFRTYYSVTDRKKGVKFLMLPASSLEKFISMVLICNILIPIGLFAAMYLVDTILALIPTNGYKNYIPINEIFSNWDMVKMYGIGLLSICFAICGNMVFKKFKFVKTIGVLFFSTILVTTLIGMASYNIIKGYSYIEKEGKIYSFTDKEEVDPASVDRSKLIVINEDDEIETSQNNGAMIIQRDGKTYKISNTNIGPGLIQFIIDNNIFVESLLEIIMLVIIPGLMYFTTYYRIRKQQL